MISAIGVSYTQVAKMSFDENFDLTAGVFLLENNTRTCIKVESDLILQVLSESKSRCIGATRFACGAMAITKTETKTRQQGFV